MERALALVGMLAACGRVDFEPRDDGGAIGDTTSCQVSPTLIQGICNNAPSTSSLAVPLFASVTTGNLLLVLVQFDDTTQTPTVMDTLGTGYIAAGPIQRSTVQSSQLFYGVAPSTGTNTVTVTMSAMPPNLAMFIAEYRGLTAVREVASERSTEDNPRSPPITTLVPNEVVFAHAITTNSVVTIEAPFTTINSCAGDATAHLLMTSPGTYTARFNLSSPGTTLLTAAALNGPCT